MLISDQLPCKPPTVAGDLLIAALQLLCELAPGAALPATDWQACEIHIQGLVDEGSVEGQSASAVAYLLAARIAPVYGRTFPGLGAEPCWYGDTAETVQRWEVELKVAPDAWEPERAAGLLDFYAGRWQWSPEMVKQRGARPMITVNRLPALVAASVARGSGRPTPAELERLRCWFTSRNIDAQRVYNWMVSNAVEMAEAVREDAGREARAADGAEAPE